QDRYADMDIGESADREPEESTAGSAEAHALPPSVPPPAGGGRSASVPPPAGGGRSASVPPPAGGGRSAPVPSPAGGGRSASAPPRAGGGRGVGDWGLGARNSDS